jgi:hypothetical protein
MDWRFSRQLRGGTVRRLREKYRFIPLSHNLLAFPRILTPSPRPESRVTAHDLTLPHDHTDVCPLTSLPSHRHSRHGTSISNTVVDSDHHRRDHDEASHSVHPGRVGKLSHSQRRYVSNCFFDLRLTCLPLAAFSHLTLILSIHPVPKCVLLAPWGTRQAGESFAVSSRFRFRSIWRNR